ncbi:hypothetical protein BD779DRAFT_1026117 [Infundibulicybe gibba]|nr:hypothetical protein BD779DRAFT_1026117 [Infundibulicybe gibba]
MVWWDCRKPLYLEGETFVSTEGDLHCALILKYPNAATPTPALMSAVTLNPINNMPNPLGRLVQRSHLAPTFNFFARLLHVHLTHLMQLILVIAIYRSTVMGLLSLTPSTLARCRGERSERSAPVCPMFTRALQHAYHEPFATEYLKSKYAGRTAIGIGIGRMLIVRWDYQISLHSEVLFD